MKAAHIFLLCLLGAALLSTVLCNSGNAPVECCVELFQKRMNKSLITSYYETDRRCHLRAAVFVTLKKERNICVDPKKTWVKNVITFLKKKSP